MTTIAQTVLTNTVTDTGSAVITDIVESPPGTFTREIRIYDQPADPTTAANLVFTLRLVSTVKMNLELTAPAALF